MIKEAVVIPMEKSEFERPSESKYLRVDVTNLPIGQKYRTPAEVMDFNLKPKSLAIAFMVTKEDSVNWNVHNDELSAPLNLAEAPAGKFKWDELQTALGKKIEYQNVKGKEMPSITPKWAEEALFTPIVVEWEVVETQTGGKRWKPVRMLPIGTSLAVPKIEEAGV